MKNLEPEVPLAVEPAVPTQAISVLSLPGPMTKAQTVVLYLSEQAFELPGEEQNRQVIYG
ncbi:MAG: hypothetical protein AB2L14_02040 [Candidatus Xenobiia bacterium LiM19]